jgi:hypothetical protein
VGEATGAHWLPDLGFVASGRRPAGFEITWVDRAPGDGRAQVESAADSGENFATVAFNREGSGAFAHVWISDHVTGKTVVRRLEVGQASNAATVLAIRALELLQASLLELSLPRPAAAPLRKPPPDVLAWVRPVPLPAAAEPLLAGPSLGISALGLVGTRGLGFALGPSLRFSHGLGEGWFARLAIAGPLLGPEPERMEGSAILHQELATLDLGLSTDARPLGVYGWIGAGVFHLHTAGSATPPFRATSDDVVSFASNAGIGVNARLGQRIALSSELGVLWLVPHPVVVIAVNGALFVPANQSMDAIWADPAFAITERVNGQIHGPVTSQITFAQGAIQGSIYYNSCFSGTRGTSGAIGGVDQGVGGRVMRIPPGGTAEIVSDSAQCVGCHSVSADGSRLVAQRAISNADTAAINASQGQLVVLYAWSVLFGSNGKPDTQNMSQLGTMGSYGALYPDGSKYLTSSGQIMFAKEYNAPGLNPPKDAALLDSTSGAIVPDTGIPTSVVMPMFSPDGTRLVFTDVKIDNAHGLAVMDYDTHNHKASHYKVSAFAHSSHCCDARGARSRSPVAAASVSELVSRSSERRGPARAIAAPTACVVATRSRAPPSHAVSHTFARGCRVPGTARATQRALESRARVE